MTDVILLAVAGSRAYGLDTEESDTDRLGVFRASTAEVLGLDWTRHSETKTSKTAEGDLTLHEVGKFIRLALVCNPTITEVLWVPNHELVTATGRLLLDARRSFLSTKKVRDAYGGYARSQVARLMNRRDSFSSSTKHRTAKHGRHTMRLLWQGTQLLESGEMEVRLTPEQRTLCFELGELAATDVDRFVAEFDKQDAAMRAASSVLPDHPDQTLANDLLLDIRRSEVW